MKQINFITAFAVLLSLLFVGCSKTPENLGSVLETGDVRIQFGLKKEMPTYATQAEEAILNTLQVWLAYQSDQAGTQKLIKLDSKAVVLQNNSATVHFVLKGSEYVPGPGALYLIGNADDPNLVFADPAQLDGAVDSKVIYTIPDKTLQLHTAGMSVTRKINLNLRPGNITEGIYADDSDPKTNQVTGGELKLRRLAARIFVVAGTPAVDITKYTISFDQTTLNSKCEYFTFTGREPGNLPLVKGYITGDDTPDNQYNKQEAVGYVYPSTGDISITITNPLGVPRTIKLIPRSNGNYQITIKPTGDSNIDFSVTVTGYDEQGNDLEADFQ